MSKPRYIVEAWFKGHKIVPTPKAAKQLGHRYAWKARQQRKALYSCSPPGWDYTVRKNV
jgi:hypothetical protein